jgi:hypothetical protein
MVANVAHLAPGRARNRPRNTDVSPGRGAISPIGLTLARQRQDTTAQSVIKSPHEASRHSYQNLKPHTMRIAAIPDAWSAFHTTPTEDAPPHPPGTLQKNHNCADVMNVTSTRSPTRWLSGQSWVEIGWNDRSWHFLCVRHTPPPHNIRARRAQGHTTHVALNMM